MFRAECFAIIAAHNGRALIEADGLKAIKAVFDGSEHDGTRSESARILVNLVRLQDGTSNLADLLRLIGCRTHAEGPTKLEPRVSLSASVAKAVAEHEAVSMLAELVTSKHELLRTEGYEAYDTLLPNMRTGRCLMCHSVTSC